MLLQYNKQTKIYTIFVQSTIRVTNVVLATSQTEENNLKGNVEKR